MLFYLPQGGTQMRYLIASDSHGRYQRLFEILEKTGPYDGVIHCGDSQLPYRFFKNEIKCPLYMVRGNCDSDVNLPLKEEIELAGHKILIVHGHRQNVKWDLQELKHLAMEAHAEIICFGHTHEALNSKVGDMYFINPGSLELPRNTAPSYAVMEIDEENVEIQLRFLN